uniref:Aminoacyl-transfer RNA synthetases class-II family profile domain-containing protein n=1 Tax=candidate division CPR3 bacterium TaxID=2268181 RepID=A0A7V3JA82_UNCC3
MLGPYYIKNNNLAYVGNKIFKPLEEVRNVRPPDLSKRHIDIKKDSRKWEAIVKIWNEIFRASAEFMKKNNVLFFDLPIITRMISSPGALTGTISSDVDPFRIKFFDETTFLTQSSQLYLEFAITNPRIDKVFCWEKSFRRERTDFRHLPEFTHIEFEANIPFEENLKFQQQYVQFLVKSLIKNIPEDLKVFLNEKDLKLLDSLSRIEKFERIKFIEAFKLLHKKTNNPKYKVPTLRWFGAYEEVLITEIIGGPVFVTEYIEEEVAFYHAKISKKSKFVRNADLLFPGYGEFIGSGERVHTKQETEEKAKHFKLNIKDYQPYIDSRTGKTKIHSGWGMGIERFIQAILELPFIWETKPFPRIDSQSRP